MSEKINRQILQVIDEWVKEFKVDLEDLSTVTYENTDNIYNKLDLIIELKDEIEKLKLEINSLKLINSILIKSDLKYRWYTKMLYKKLKELNLI